MSNHTLVGLSGSLRAGSFNTMLMQEAGRIYAPDQFIQGNMRLPLYDGDLEDQGIPSEVQTLADQIRSADAVVIATPEYNKMISGVMKNALDWLSRVKPGPWQDKPVAIMSATAGRTGGEVALFTLRHAMAPFRAHLHSAPATMVASSFEAFDENGRLKSDRYVQSLTDQMTALRALADRG